ncbi:5-hydroxyisourate hydrolase [Pandoraea aquatica]|uniref:5-hydroxyisourate hydrolase n=1 Tax=Pandoraea aquatica TaxID=2508290 RepID=A0A5E4SUX1_9BURK|nr:hydroxyisourate hydrolase [Pandoraea aquatica]VVD78573.1 5-hydroxyisourate hydrolase [Pandoraea aquatica]
MEMHGISVHVVDVSRGLVAQGLAVRLEHLSTHGRIVLIASRIGARGTLEELDDLKSQCVPGTYEATFSVGDYYRRAGVSMPTVPFLDEVPYRFGLADSGQHYHLPFKMTPWGFSCFRGGA